MGRILAIDSGLTVTKAALFDLNGRQVGVSRRILPQIMPAPRRVERDMAAFWEQTASAIRDVLAESATDPSDIIAIAATAHGDGVYLLDAGAKPLGHGILSLDSRAHGVVEDWEVQGLQQRCLQVTGQVSHASAPSALLAWMRVKEPERFARIGHVLACKDWLRFCLTGSIGTDRTEASTSFTAVQEQTYSAEALEMFGLSALQPALPPISPSADIVGTVSAEAAAATGLVAGTPVAAGLHDVTASALGIGAHRPGIVGIVAGTYSINECVSDSPQVDPRWFCRAAIAPGQWNSMAISPASTTNYDWFVDTFCAADRAQAEAAGQSIHSILAAEIDAGLASASSVLYHPYLFGSPFGAGPSAGFLGLRGWHGRGDVMAALLEGIVFNHRQHVDALRTCFAVEVAHLTGGASRNRAVAQLFADVLALPVMVTETDEAAAWGAALCAGAAVGAFDRFDADPRDLEATATHYHPDPARAAHYEKRYEVYRDVADRLPDVWQKLNALDAMPRGGGDG